MCADSKNPLNNAPKAVELYRFGASRGHAEAQIKLGDLYASGKGVDRNMCEAAALYQQAAEQGFVEARSRLDSL